MAKHIKIAKCCTGVSTRDMNWDDLGQDVLIRSLLLQMVKATWTVVKKECNTGHNLKGY